MLLLVNMLIQLCYTHRRNMLITNSAPPTREQLTNLLPLTEIQYIINLGAEGSTTDGYEFKKKYPIVTSSIILEWLVKFLTSLPKTNYSYEPYVDDLHDGLYDFLMEGRSHSIGDLREDCVKFINSWKKNTEGKQQETLAMLGKYMLDCLPSEHFTVTSIGDAFISVTNIVDIGIRSSISHNDTEKSREVLDTACSSYARELNENALNILEESSLGFTRPAQERDFETTEAQYPNPIDSVANSLNAIVMSPLVGETVQMCNNDVCERLCSMLWDEWNWTPKYRLIPFSTPGFQ